MRDEKGRIVPRDKEAFHIARMQDKRKLQETEEHGSLAAMPNMNAPSAISKVFLRNERVPNMMTRRIRLAQENQDYLPPLVFPKGTTLQKGAKPNIAPLVRKETEKEIGERESEKEIEKPQEKVITELPAHVQKELDRIDNGIGEIHEDIAIMIDFIDKLVERIGRSRNQDIDALFRNRCSRRRTEGYCRLTVKGKSAKGKQPYCQRE